MLKPKDKICVHLTDFLEKIWAIFVIFCYNNSHFNASWIAFRRFEEPVERTNRKNLRISLYKNYKKCPDHPIVSV